MACIAENRRPGKLVVDYVDAAGKRRWKTFDKTPAGKRAAQMFLGESERKLSAGEQSVDEKIKFKEAADRWLLQCQASLSPQTHANYRWHLRSHLGPRMDGRALAKVTRSIFKVHVAEIVASGALARSTISTIVGTARTFFAWCIEEGLIVANPADRVLKALGIQKRRKDTIKAMTREQLSSFLGAARRLLDEDSHLELLLLARTATRIGESHGLQWGDFLDEERPRIRVERQVTIRGAVVPPKTAKGRRLIDVSTDLRDALRETWARRHEARLKMGVPMSVWIVRPEWPVAPSAQHSRAARKMTARNMDRALSDVKLPHFTPHSLRHTHATLLLMQGEPVQYVQQQLGHANISETVDCYGSWIQAESPGAVDRLADRTKARESADVAVFKS